MELTTKDRLLKGDKFVLITDEQECRSLIYWIDSKMYITDSLDRQIAHVVLKDNFLHYSVRLPGESVSSRIYYSNIKFV